MIRKLLLYTLISGLFVPSVFSRDGMWIPSLLKKYNIEEMQRMGFRLTAEDVYDINNASMKDAVVQFGGGCTGELISGEGLLITNHHCGYGQIQRHSSIEHDYLTDGFWAKSRAEELACPGLTVSFLERMEDVTATVLQGTDTISNPVRKSDRIRLNSGALEREAANGGKFRAMVRPLFYGNQYFLHVYKIYTDVRLVGAPPSSIGKFGGDTDNWVWPRHTGDFSLFRIYAGKDNEPASYSKENVPFKPKKFLTISLKGVETGDFTMVFGYPGRTTQYLTSEGVNLIMNQRDPDRIGVRDIKLEIMDRYMKKDPVVRIQYAAKYAGVSNAWKKWQGEILGLKKNNAVAKKQQFEAAFKNWAELNNLWENKYREVLSGLQTAQTSYAPFARASDYYAEIVNGGVEIFSLAKTIQDNLKGLQNQKEVTSEWRSALLRQVGRFYRESYQPLDEELFDRLLPVLNSKVDPSFLPEQFKTMMAKNTSATALSAFYQKSMLADSVRLLALIRTAKADKLNKISKDPMMILNSELRKKYEEEIQPKVVAMEAGIEAGMKLWMEGIMQLEKGKALYPDANSTLRVSYGKVEGFMPTDGVLYKPYTTLDGVMQKFNPAIEDYAVPPGLKDLYDKKDYGRYGEKGKLPVCFVASNHTSGGNSGSPVVNFNGELIGVNFDRCWEGTMSDVMYDPEICRNIILDIRYALFVIDKYAGAGYLLEEMKLAN